MKMTRGFLIELPAPEQGLCYSSVSLISSLMPPMLIIVPSCTIFSSISPWPSAESTELMASSGEEASRSFSTTRQVAAAVVLAPNVPFSFAFSIQRKRFLASSAVFYS